MLIIILLDSREQNGPYISKRLAEAGIDSEIVCFPQNTGCDYLIAADKGTCAIQRKVAVPELSGQLDEILYDIAPRLSGFSDNPCLLVEENFIITEDGYLQNRNDQFETGLLATSYYGFLETLRKMGLDVYTTRDLNHSIWWMIGMHGYLSKNHYPKHKKYFSVQEQAMGMMMAVPGIGEARAKKALNGSCIADMNTGKVEGLTDTMMMKLQKVLRHKNV